LKLTDIKGIKEKREKLLNSLGIFTPVDLLNYFPSKYYDLTRLEGVEEKASPKLIRAKVLSVSKKGYRKGAITAAAVCQNRKINIVWFNQPYVYEKLLQDTEYVFFGRCLFQKGITLVNPLYEKADEVKKLKGIFPVYRLCEGLSQSVLGMAISDLLDKNLTESIVTADTANKFNLADITKAYKVVHKPQKMEDVKEAYDRIILEMLLFRLIKLHIQGSINLNRQVYYDKEKTIVNEFISSLGFELTNGQKKCVNEILDDLKSGKVMNRLLLGDVGSGKTVVAFAAMYFAARCGGQCAYIAPTELLARQQYSSALKMFKNFGFDLELLTGSLSDIQKKNVLFNIKNKICNVLFTTHSILSENVNFADLRLVVCDEQHRFGVKQRSLIQNKGGKADMLIMSATPLPRTLNLALFGELSVSELNERPFGQSNVDTHLVPQNKIKDMYAFIRGLIKDGKQIYIVSRSIEADTVEETGAKKLYKELCAGELKGIKCALLHGDMKESEKTDTMEKYITGEVSVLISTSIIEVGIDVKNAAAIVIYGADKFGLAQLHQLRGRVGRDTGRKKSYCFLLYDNLSEEGVKRLEALKTCTDGFALAEIDLKMRGAGDFLGLKQHGTAGIGNISADESMIFKALEIYKYIIKDKDYTEKLKDKFGLYEEENIVFN
jgi:ATP-dependent DNA helicase RecG